jgi:F0F1-type ATP synthase assembly protein I
MTMYIGAVLTTIVAWFIGLFLDANIGFEPMGILELRILFPVLTMGVFILKVINDKNSK